MRGNGTLGRRDGHIPPHPFSREGAHPLRSIVPSPLCVRCYLLWVWGGEVPRWGHWRLRPLAPAGTAAAPRGRQPPRPGWPASHARSRVMSAACRQVWMFCQRSRVYDHPQMCIQEHTVPTAEINAGLTAGQAAHTGERKKDNKNCLMLFINYTLADEKYISLAPPPLPPSPSSLPREPEPRPAEYGLLFSSCVGWVPGPGRWVRASCFLPPPRPYLM